MILNVAENIFVASLAIMEQVLMIIQREWFYFSMTRPIMFVEGAVHQMFVSSFTD